MRLEIGDKAPDFTLPTDGDGKVTLSKLKGKKVVLYFYPKDDTTGCTAEACAFRDSHETFTELAPGFVQETITHGSHSEFVVFADGNGDGIATCDIGAFEVQPNVSPTPTLSPSATLTFTPRPTNTAPPTNTALPALPTSTRPSTFSPP